MLAACTASRHGSPHPTTVPATAPTAAGTAPIVGSELPPNAIDLGTLGGAYSTPTAMSGTVVVGFSGATPGGGGSELGRAFAVDLAAAHPHVRDLGTLGGPHSRANAVDGTWVVGWASSASAPMHPFAYDLAAARSSMLDLGTPAAVPVGAGCSAAAIRGGWVVGNCGWQGAQVMSRAFAYDLGARQPIMIDLGTLGGPSSTVIATDGVWAVGGSDTAGGDSHAFAYRLAAPHPVLQDLGTLGTWSNPLFIKAGWVVGESPSADGVHAFAYNLNAPAGAMIDLGTLGGTSTYPTALQGGWVVGSSSTAGGTQHAFAYDLNSTNPHLIDLGTLGGPTSAAVAIDNGWVAGTALTRANERHLFAYNLNAAQPHMIDLGMLGDLSTQPVADGAGWVVGGPVSTRSGYTSHAWAVHLP